MQRDSGNRAIIADRDRIEAIFGANAAILYLDIILSGSIVMVKARNFRGRIQTTQIDKATIYCDLTSHYDV